MKKAPTCPDCGAKLKAAKTFYWCNNRRCPAREERGEGTAVITINKVKP